MLEDERCTGLVLELRSPDFYKLFFSPWKSYFVYIKRSSALIHDQLELIGHEDDAILY